MKSWRMFVQVSRLFAQFKAVTLMHFFGLFPLKGNRSLSKEDSGFRKLSWEYKARQNLMWAIQTTEDVLKLKNRDVYDRNIPAVRAFWEKGHRVYEKHLHPLVYSDMTNPEWCVIEYGCGVGRILENFVSYQGKKIGLDISKEQLKYARKINSGIDFRLVQEIGDSLNAKADFVYSFAVFKHIGKLSKYEEAVRQCCELLKAGGTLALNVHSEDFTKLGQVETFNYETFSIHKLKTTNLVETIHYQDSNWSGVYIGFSYLETLLWHEGIRVLKVYQHNPTVKAGNIWIVGKKETPKRLPSSATSGD